jgi:hypothetical protein
MPIHAPTIVDDSNIDINALYVAVQARSVRIADATVVQLSPASVAVGVHVTSIKDDTALRLGISSVLVACTPSFISDDSNVPLFCEHVVCATAPPEIEIEEWDIIDSGEAWNMFTEEELKQMVMQGQKVKVGEVSKENVSVEDLIKLEQYLAKRDANPFRLLRVATVVVKDRQETDLG